MNTFQKTEKRERRRFSNRFKLTAFSINVFSFRKSSFKFDTINQLNLTRFNTQNIVNQIIQKFYDTTFKDKRFRRQSITSSIIENDIDDSKKNIKMRRRSFLINMLHFMIETSIYYFFFQQNQKKLIILRISDVSHSTLSKKRKKKKIFKFHFIDENENRKYIIDDVENFRTQINQKLDN